VLLLLLGCVAPVLGRVHGSLVPAIGNNELRALISSAFTVHRKSEINSTCAMAFSDASAERLECHVQIYRARRVPRCEVEMMHYAFDFGCACMCAWIADYTSTLSPRRGRLLQEEKMGGAFLLRKPAAQLIEGPLGSRAVWPTCGPASALPSSGTGLRHG
jgi:hypothetical protein